VFSLTAELACHAASTEEEDLVLVLVVVGVDEVGSPADGVLVRLARAFITDQRLPHVRTLADADGGDKMSTRDASSTALAHLSQRHGRKRGRLAFDDAAAAALERGQPAKLHHLGTVALAVAC